MAHLEDVAVFVAVAEQGSFTKAAKEMGLPPTTVSRRVRELEGRLGVRLLHRTTRSLALTDQGERYFAACRNGLAAINEADRAAQEAQSEPSGVIRISAPVNFGASIFAEGVTEFLVRYPRVKAELILTDERVDLVRMRIDAALRTGNLPDSNFVARKLSTTRRIFCASPGYLERKGVPATPEDLRHHDCVLRGESTEGVAWVFKGPNGEQSIPVGGRVSVNVMSVVLEAALAGLGIAQVPEGLVETDVRAGRLVPVLDSFATEETGLYIVLPSNRHLSAAVRAFADHVVEWAASRSRRSWDSQSAA
jgi:DNA-binding transcriptional LysR family regulator